MTFESLQGGLDTKIKASVTCIDMPVTTIIRGIVSRLVSRKLKIQANKPSAVSFFPQGTCSSRLGFRCHPLCLILMMQKVVSRYILAKADYKPLN